MNTSKHTDCKKTYNHTIVLSTRTTSDRLCNRYAGISANHGQYPLTDYFGINVLKVVVTLFSTESSGRVSIPSCGHQSKRRKLELGMCTPSWYGSVGTRYIQSMRFSVKLGFFLACARIVEVGAGLFARQL